MVSVNVGETNILGNFVPIIVFTILLISTLYYLGKFGRDGKNQAYLMIFGCIAFCIYLIIAKYTNMGSWITMVSIGVFMALLLWLLLSTSIEGDICKEKEEEERVA